MDTIQDDDGVWLTDKWQIERYAADFFRKLFLVENNFTPFRLANSFPDLDVDEVDSLGKHVTRDEIKLSVIWVASKLLVLTKCMLFSTNLNGKG